MKRAVAWAVAAAALLLGAGPGRASEEGDRKAVERENERRAKAGLLPRKEPPRPVPSGEVTPATAPAGSAPSDERGQAPAALSPLTSRPIPPAAPSLAPGAAPGAPPPTAAPPVPRSAQPPPGPAAPPRRVGPLEAAVAAGRGLSPAGAYGGPEVAVDETVAGSLTGLAVRSGLRVRAGDVLLVVDRTR